jgi:ADP-dependent NAD(P)H-hydrate dehydratase / NAD(P)H-hydrate epimerase
VVAGSYGKMGAAVLCSKSCLRSGAGLVTAYIPESGMYILQSSFPEAMAVTDNKSIDFNRINAIGIGPGFGTDSEEKLQTILESFDKPMVFDADAITILANKPEMISLVPKNSIFTPHVKEFDRLAGDSENGFERLEKAQKFAFEQQVIVVLKGAFTAVCSPDGNVFFNTTGNSGMATGGSGDVLTGIITGLLAQHYQPLETAIFGVFLHGLAGDFAIEKQSKESMIASDIIDCLGVAFKAI